MVTVDETKCSGCSTCVTMCPREAITALGTAKIDSQKCTDCFGGVHFFAEDAPLSDKQATLDQARTYWRRKCLDYCPTGAIVEVEQ